ncbi:MAG TPA: hypothetical protein VLT33_20380 [Labilithrix sp.]|nr:hypothetical protein [Labilithrix sp.]
MSKRSLTLPPARVLGRLGPAQVGPFAAGLVGACSLSALLALGSLSGPPLPVLLSNAAFIAVGAAAMRVVLRAPQVGPARCTVAGAAAGAASAVLLVAILELFERGAPGRMAFGIMLALAVGGVVGAAAGLALTPLARAIARAGASPALDRADRALSASAWWMLGSGALSSMLQAPRAEPSTLVGLLALALASTAFVVVAVREQRRRRRVVDAEAHAADAGREGPGLAVVAASELRVGGGLAAEAAPLCTGDPGDSFLVEQLVAEGPVFRAAAAPSRVLGRVTPALARQLTNRRAVVAEVGAALAAGLAMISVLAFLDARHYRYRGSIPLPTRVDGFEDDAPRSFATANGGVCAITKSDHVRCFGNGAGRFLDASHVQRFDAAPLPGIGGVRRLAVGRAHACILPSGDVPRCWGGGGYGAIGDGQTSDRFAPVTVSRIDSVVDLALGDDFSLALLRDGTVWQWGRDPAVPLRGDAGDRLLPTRVEGIAKAIAITAAASSACAILEDQRVTCWGSDQNGVASGPTVVPLPPIRTVRLGYSAGWALAIDGSVWSWGRQLEDADLAGPHAPRRVERLQGAVDIAPGLAFACALMPDGTVPCWGSGADGALGDGAKDTGYRETRARLSDVTAITAGDRGACASKRDGTVWCWGWL